MTDQERAHAAQAILAIPLFNELMNDLEQQAINAAVYALYNDNEARQAHCATIRVIRELRSRIEVLAKDNEKQSKRKGFA